MKKINDILKIFALIVAFAFSGQAWGNTWTANVGVGSGKGSAVAKINSDAFIGGGVQKTSDAATSTTTKQAKWSSTFSSTKGHAIFEATADAGYSFDAWYTNTGCSTGKVTGNPYSTTSNKGGTYTYYAKFVANTYTVTFNPESGSVSPTTSKVTYDANYGNGTGGWPTPTRANYTFVGWYTAASGGTKIESATKVQITSAQTLHAHWEPNYTIRFNGNGSNGGSMNNLAMVHGTAEDLTLNGFSRVYTVNYDVDGGTAIAAATATYTFAGWATSADGAVVYTNGQSVNNLSSTAGAVVDLFAKWNSASITLPEATQAGKIFDAWFIGDTKIGEKNESYTPTSNVTLTAKWIDKLRPKFKLNGVDLPAEPVEELHLLVGETATMTFENTDETNNRFSYPKNPSFVSYNHSTGVITGASAGNEYIQFAQTGTDLIYEHTRSIHVFVEKHPVTLTTSLDGATWKVDDLYNESELYNLGTVATGNQPALSGIIVTSSNTDVIDFVNGQWKAKADGEATLTISHPATNVYWDAATTTAHITVEKYDPEFTWNLPATVNYNRAFTSPVTSTNTMEGCAFSYTSGNTSVINWTNNTLRTFEKAGSHVGVTVTQQGNYKWNSKTQTFYVDVAKLPNHVEFTVNSEAVYNAVYANKQGEVAWAGSDGIRLGGSSTKITGGPAYNWEDKYIIINFEGIPKKISFTTGLTSNVATANVVWPGSGTNNGYWYMEQKSETGNWSNVWTEESSNNPGSISKDLNPDTRYVKICYTGNFAGYVKNLKITERTEIRSGKDKLDFGSADAGSDATSQNVNISWYNVNPLTLSIKHGSDKYSVSPTSIESSKDNYAIGVPVTVSYKHTAGGTHVDTLVITDGDVTKQISLTGTTNKVTPAITWKENLTPMSRGENVTDPAEAIVALTYTSSDSTIVDVDGNVLKPLKKGNATITASYDGTTDSVYNSNSSTINVLVTNLAVQHINWTQTFTRLKWTDDAVLSDKNTPDFDLEATVSYYDPESEQEVVITDRAISYTSGNEAVVQVLPGNKLHVVGQGPTTLTAHIDGIVDSLYEATVIRNVIVREPTLDCDTWVLEDQSASMATEINSFSGVETVYNLTGEPGYLTFSAWREAIHILTDWTGGNLFVAEWYNNNWHELTGAEGLDLDLNTPKDFGPIALSREATKVKIFKKTGSTGIHAFSGAYVTLARYLELENTKNKKTHAINLTTDEAKPGVIVEKTFTVNYSNITDQLDVELKHGDKFSIVSATTIGNECGDKGTATVRVRFLSNDVDLYRDTLLVHNLTDTVMVYLSADVDKHHQQITWNPATQDLKTTDNVTFNATTSAAAAGLTVSYAVTAGSDVATVNVATGELTILKGGDVTVEATCAGNNKYYDAEAVAYIFHIAKAKPEITVFPTAATMTLPNTLLSACGLTGTASVEGSFAWADGTIAATLNNSGYTAIFTPTDANKYDTIHCTVVVPVNKAAQSIVWNFSTLEMFCNAEYTFDAYATPSGLAVTYETSDPNIAYVDGENRLRIIKGGDVTITAVQTGNATYAAAESVAKNLKIKRFTPEIITMPSATSMFIGRLLSDASLTGGSAELNGIPVEGSFAWVGGNDTYMNTAGSFTMDIAFNPANSNYYEPVYSTLTVTVDKYAPTITANNLSASSIEFPAQLSQSTLSGSVTAMDFVKIPNEVVAGTVAWKEPTKVLRPGVHTATVLFTPTNTSWYDAVEIPVLIEVTGGFIFDGDNTTWTEAHNWNGDLLPQANDPVLINSDVEITTTITVGSLTINENVNVIVKEGAVLTIGNDNSETRAAYGNLLIEAGGEVILGDGELDVNDFTIEASIGDKTYAAKSGQLRRSANLNVHRDAYFDLVLDQSGECSYGWYDFSVPFPVDVNGGVVARWENDGSDYNGALRNGTHYSIMAHYEDLRANGQYSWKKFSGVMQPGQCYTITVNNTAPNYRFKKKAGTSIAASEVLQLQKTDGTGTEADKGWNALGNGLLAMANLNMESSRKVQLYDHATNTYTNYTAGELTFAIGSAFFIQATGNGSVSLVETNAPRALRAPVRRAAVENEEYRVRLTPAGASRFDDQMFLSAAEEASNSYEIGHDMKKMASASSAKIAQIWCSAYGLELCDVELPMTEGGTYFPLGMYSPKAGEYEISAMEGPADTELWLMYEDMPVWNLSNGSYTIELGKGTTNSYSLMLKQGGHYTPTGSEVVSGDNAQAHKLIINDNLYIIRDGIRYDATGKRVD